MLEAAGRAISRSPELSGAAGETAAILPQEWMPRREKLLARFVGEVTENVQLACANSVLEDVLKGNFFNVFKLVGAIGSLYAMIIFAVILSLVSRAPGHAQKSPRLWGVAAKGIEQLDRAPSRKSVWPGCHPAR